MAVPAERLDQLGVMISTKTLDDVFYGLLLVASLRPTLFSAHDRMSRMLNCVPIIPIANPPSPSI